MKIVVFYINKHATSRGESKQLLLGGKNSGVESTPLQYRI